jgi:hypothetical protein
VLTRWKELNPAYQIEVSLDKDCIEFLKAHFNDTLADLFKTTYNGMNKADLWRLCKLYIYGGIYADVDLVPYLNIDHLNKDVTFYGGLSKGPVCFQDFLVSRNPKSPLLLAFLQSLIYNKSINGCGPKIDMYDCLKRVLKSDPVESTLYKINIVEVKINIGSSDSNIKKINLHYFPNNAPQSIILTTHNYPDTFEFLMENNILTVTRTDIKSSGWGHNHSCTLFYKCDEQIYLFKESTTADNNRVKAKVIDNGVKLFDSRDEEYYVNRGW